MQQVPIVKQVVQLAAVDLVEGNHEAQIRVVSHINDDVVGGHQVEPGNFAVVSAHHCESFARTRLTVSEASRVGPVKTVLDQRLHALSVNLRQFA